MSLSKAKKRRQKLERDGKRNPAANRNGWNGLRPVERTTPSLAERTYNLQRKHKKKWNQSLQAEDGSISFYALGA